jgi:hypothetical protein
MVAAEILIASAKPKINCHKEVLLHRPKKESE